MMPSELMDFEHSQRALETLGRLRAFIDERIVPIEDDYFRSLRARNHGGDWTKWTVDSRVEALKQQARDARLWNLFLPGTMSTIDYAPLAEAMGRSALAPEIFNCNAPDSGNMEVLHLHGSDDQKRRWLEPLLAGEIRSVFCMTEPDVASSDATNIRATIAVDRDELIINGRKWWTTGLGHPRARIAIFMGRSDPENGRHEQHSMVLVPLDTPGVTIERMLPAFGDYDEPHGHGEISFRDVRVPASNLIGGRGRGFEIAQSRLGPGRIHHCMRAIGAAEHALRLMITRGMTRVAFGKPLVDLDGNRERIAALRIAIDQARLLTLHAAWKIDSGGAAAATAEVSAIKVAVPNMLQRVVDEAIQMYGGAGLSQDVPLTNLFAMARALRIADGPDAVHLARIARLELRKYASR